MYKFLKPFFFHVINMSIAVSGSRSFKNYKKFKEEFKKSLDLLSKKKNFKMKEIVTGGAKGTDQLAEKYAKENHIEVIILKPEWKIHGRYAGIKRNKDIIDRCNYLVAFWDGNSNGTKSAIDYSKKCKKHFITVDVSSF